jgi:hypothetical protein
VKHIEFLVRLSLRPEDAGSALVGDDEVREYANDDTVRGMVRALVVSAEGLLADQWALWQLWIEWELRVLAATTGEEK